MDVNDVKRVLSPWYKMSSLDDIITGLLAVAIHKNIPEVLLGRLVHFQYSNIQMLLDWLSIDKSLYAKILKEAQDAIEWVNPEDIEVRINWDDLEIIFHWKDCTCNEEKVDEEEDDIESEEEEDDEELDELDATQVVEHMEAWRKAEQKKYTTKKAFWYAYNAELFNFINIL